MLKICVTCRVDCVDARSYTKCYFFSLMHSSPVGGGIVLAAHKLKEIKINDNLAKKLSKFVDN